MPEAASTPEAAISAAEPATDALRPARTLVPDRLLRQVREASYLVAENAPRYRPIMRFLYLEHMQHRYTHRLHEVHEWMRTHVDPAYTEEQCEQDLRALVEWGNLYAEQDRSRATTVEEFVRRQLRYGLTPYGIAFERLLVELESQRNTGGSLDVGLIDVLWEQLREIDVQLGQPEHGAPGDGRSATATPGGGSAGADAQRDGNGAGEAEREALPARPALQALFTRWTQAIDAFDKLGSQSSDYLAALHRGAREQMADLDAFLAYKNLLVEYLASFVDGLYNQGQRIRSLLAAWERSGKAARLLEWLVAFETRYRPGADRLPTADEVRPVREAEWRRLVGWFRPDGGWETLRKRTASAIEQVTRQAQRLMDRRVAVSRRHDLERLAVAFARLERLDDAHRLAGLAFGAPAPRHLLGSAEVFMLDDGGSAWEVAPQLIELAPVRRGRQESGRGAAVRPRREEQQRVLEAERARRQAEAAIWEAIFRDGEIDLGSLTVKEPAVRLRLLAVLGRCLVSPDWTAQAPDGSIIELKPPQPFSVGTLSAPDGRLHLPAFRMVRRPPAFARRGQGVPAHGASSAATTAVVAVSAAAGSGDSGLDGGQPPHP
ncbi:TIGR02677 family protein [Geochorda subterranea]|uniref:TIGR02677 family protein n=1 Tax=Geochorda subterranea TaxID=3109564 RepID=A0ABZ1BMC6_9FIRM|nr:TIGR02677 family protein [Limnochorda sp. LNt]WRP13701.1 TIGR02677 family protein [Limnochorda sp. LNt]